MILALTRGGVLGAPTLTGQPGPPPLVWVTIAPPLLQHAGSVLIQSGLAPGVQASWTSAILGTAQPTAGQALAFAVALLPPGLLRVGTLYLAMRLARTAARDGVYTVQAARLVLILGWWLLAGGLVTSIAEGFAQLNLLRLLVTDVTLTRADDGAIRCQVRFTGGQQRLHQRHAGQGAAAALRPAICRSPCRGSLQPPGYPCSPW